MARPRLGRMERWAQVTAHRDAHCVPAQTQHLLPACLFVVPPQSLFGLRSREPFPSELRLAPAACGVVTVPGSFWAVVTASAAPPHRPWGCCVCCPAAEGAGQDKGHCFQASRLWTHVGTSGAGAHPHIGTPPPFPLASLARHPCCSLHAPIHPPHLTRQRHTLLCMGGGPAAPSCPPSFPPAVASSRTDGVTLALTGPQRWRLSEVCLARPISGVFILALVWIVH